MSDQGEIYEHGFGHTDGGCTIGNGRCTFLMGDDRAGSKDAYVMWVRWRASDESDGS